MTPARRYLLGTVLIALLTAALGPIIGPKLRPAVLLSLGLALVVQVPLGYWLIVAVGTRRFLAAWVLGMLLRMGMVGLTGLVILPALGWALGPTLIALLILLLLFPLLEGAVLLLAQPKAEAR